MTCFWSRIERSTVPSARQITVLGNKADQTSQALRPRIIGADVTLQAPIARPKKEAEAHLSRGKLQPGRLREGRASESTCLSQVRVVEDGGSVDPRAGQADGQSGGDLDLVYVQLTGEGTGSSVHCRNHTCTSALLSVNLDGPIIWIRSLGGSHAWGWDLMNLESSPLDLSNSYRTDSAWLVFRARVWYGATLTRAGL